MNKTNHSQEPDRVDPKPVQNNRDVAVDDIIEMIFKNPSIEDQNYIAVSVIKKVVEIRRDMADEQDRYSERLQAGNDELLMFPKMLK